MELLSEALVHELADCIRPVIRDELASFVSRIPKPVQENDRLNVEQAGELLGYTSNTVYTKCCRKEIPYKKFNGRLIFSRKELTAWMNENTK